MMLKPDWNAMRNKLLSLVLTLAMFVSMFSVCAFAAQSDTMRYQIGEAVYAELSEGGAMMLSGDGDTWDYSPQSPAPWYTNKALIASVQIEDGITSLGDYLFYNCKNLTGKLILPASLTSIGDRAFSGDSFESAPKLHTIINEFTEIEVVVDAGDAQDSVYIVEPDTEIFSPTQGEESAATELATETKKSATDELMGEAPAADESTNDESGEEEFAVENGIEENSAGTGPETAASSADEQLENEAKKLIIEDIKTSLVSEPAVLKNSNEDTTSSEDESAVESFLTTSDENAATGDALQPSSTPDIASGADSIEASEQPEENLVTEQTLGENVFFSGQSGVFSLAGAHNESFRAAALEANYTEVTDWTNMTFSDGLGTELTVAVPETKNGLFLPSYVDTGILEPTGKSFLGWMQNGILCATHSFQAELDITLPLTAVWQSTRTDQTLRETIDGREITVSGDLPEGAQLSVERVSLETAAQMVTDRFGENTSSVCFAYDITLLVNGEKYQPTDFGSSVRVTIGAVSVADDFAVLHFKSDDTVETLPVEADGDSAAFETDSFSLYIGVNKWVKLPIEIWYNGTGFYKDEGCTTIINNSDGQAFTDLQTLLNHISSDLIIYMKAGYTVSGTQSITGGTAYTVTLKRYDDTSEANADYLGNLLSVATGESLTLSNITVDGGAVWTGAVDATLGRGTVNNGLTATSALINVGMSGSLTLLNDAVLQNNALSGDASSAKYGAGVWLMQQAQVIINGGVVRNNQAVCGGGIYASDAAMAQMTDGMVVGNYSTAQGGGFFGNFEELTISGGSASRNFSHTEGGAIAFSGTLNLRGGVISDNTSETSLGGAAVYTFSGTVNIFENVLIERNVSPGGVIALYCFDNTSAPTLNMTGGAIRNNNAAGITTRKNVADATITAKAAVNISGGTIVGNTTADINILHPDNAALIVTGGSVQSIIGTVPTNGAETPDNVYRTAIALDGATQELEVISLDPNACNYGAASVAADNEGIIYLWLPVNTVITKVQTVAGTYVGTATTNANGTASERFHLSPKCWTDAGNYDTGWYVESAPEATAYTVDTVEELAGLSAIVNGLAYKTTLENGVLVPTSETIAQDDFFGKTITLNASVSLNSMGSSVQWNPIGSENGVFNGTFDGAGHALSDVYINVNDGNQGLFGYVGDGGVVKNVRVAGNIISNNGQGIGSIAGVNHGTILNCYNAASISGKEQIGGIAGYNYTGAVIRNCYNSGDVSAAKQYGGGIVGRNLGTVENCYSTGAVSGGSYLGGIVGRSVNGTVQYAYYLKSATVNVSLNAAGAATGKITSLGSFADSGGALTESNGTTLIYGAALLAALNGWVSANKAAYSDLKYWTADAAVNDGSPTLTDTVPPAPLTGNWADAGNYDTSWYFDTSGNALVDELNFTLYDAADLAGLAQIVNGTGYRTNLNGEKVGDTLITADTFADQTITLAQDISLNNGGQLTRQWTPISKKSFPFSGSFDGGSHTISGLYIDDASNNYCALFGAVSGGVIKNLCVSGSITGGANIGGIVGHAAGGATVDNCHSSIAVVGKQAGGIIGYIEAGALTNCSNTGVISSNLYNAGGMVGYIEQGNINNCYNTGAISSTSGNVGGIAGGTSASNVYISNCYNIGALTSSERGAIANMATAGLTPSSISNCYFFEYTDLKISNIIGGIFYSGTFTSSTSILTAGTVSNCFSEQTLQYGDDLLAALNGWVSANKATYPDLKYWTTAAGVNGGYPTLTDTEPPAPLTGNWADEGNYDTSWYLDDTSKTSYTISNAAQLAGLAVLVNGHDNTNSLGYYKTEPGTTIKTGNLLNTAYNMSGKTITLGADIALNSGDTLSRQWTAIGTSSFLFKGTFNGNNHTISQLYMKVDNTNESNQGLFGYSGGTVLNTSVDGTITASSSSIGGIVGYNTGLIDSCCNRASISGSWSVGGIAGTNSGTVQNCKNTGNVAGVNQIGGIVGSNNANIRNCYNTAEIRGTNIGGIAGYTEATIQNCYSTGNVIGSQAQNPGAIVGYVDAASNISDCYYLKISGVNATLGIGGNSESGATYKNCGTFKDSGGLLTLQVSSLPSGTTLLSALYCGGAAKNDPALKSWKIVPGENNGYPVFSDEPYLTGNWADQGNYDTSWYFSDTAALSYTLYDAADLAGLAVLVNAADSRGTAGTYLNTSTGNDVTGAGSISFSGKTITLGADVALNVDGMLARQWTPIGKASGTSFSGSFDGAGHTVSGLYISGGQVMGLFGYFNGTGFLQNLTVRGSITGLTWVAGIVVAFDATGGIRNCVNYCELNLDNGSSNSGHIGGIVGNCNASIENCINYGTITCNIAWFIGGIAGQSDASMKNCTNYGTLTCRKAEYMGGIVGSAAYNSNETFIQNCSNFADVIDHNNVSSSITSSKWIGGIAGVQTEVTIRNCMSTGNVKGGTGVGGIVGYNARGKIYNCYSTGTVTATTNAGGVCGESKGSNCEVKYSYSKSATAVGTNDGENLTSFLTVVEGTGYFSDSGGALSPAGVASNINRGIYIPGLAYGTNLLSALNGWVAAQASTELSGWEIIDGVNNGYPVLTGNPLVNTPQTKQVTLYACDEISRGADKPNTVTLDLAKLFGSIAGLRGKTISVTDCVVNDLTLDAYDTVYAQRRNAGYGTANTHFGVTTKLNNGTPLNMSDMSGTPALGAIAADATSASLTLTLYNYNALTTSGSAGTVTLTLTDGTNIQHVEITIDRSVSNLSASVPLNVAAAVTAEGDFIFPSGKSYTIKNNSAFPIELTNVTWTWIGDDGASGNTKTGVFALVNNARSMTPTLGFDSGQTTYSFNTGQSNTASSVITASQMLAHNGILPGELQLWWNLTLGKTCYFYDAWDGSLPIATITYTIAAAQNALGTQ